MINYLITSLLFTLFHIGLAEAQNEVSGSAEYYILNEWPGAYQDGYEVKKQIYLNLYQSPDNQIPLGSCALNKGRTFHPFSTQNLNDKFIIVSGVKIYRAKQDVVDDLGYKHEKGNLVLQLAELSEGVCKLQDDHEIYEDTCPSMYDTWELIKASPLQDYRMIQTSCNNGVSGWIMESELQSYLKVEDINASVVLMPEDELYERGWNLD